MIDEPTLGSQKTRGPWEWARFAEARNVRAGGAAPHYRQLSHVGKSALEIGNDVTRIYQSDRKTHKLVDDSEPVTLITADVVVAVEGRRRGRAEYPAKLRRGIPAVTCLKRCSF